MKLAKLTLTDYDYLGFEQLFLVPDGMTEDDWICECEAAIASIPSSIPARRIVYKPYMLEHAAAELAEKFESVDVELVCNYVAGDMDVCLPLRPELKQKVIDLERKMATEDVLCEWLYNRRAEEWEEIL